MSEVRILSEIIANKIAAGEVVERPASVVKELIENSLDAGAKRISIEIEKGGSDLIRVSDDGHGMSRENAILSIQRYATSKIFNDDDLFSIKTFGFRGEAIPSIASVSEFTMITRANEKIWNDNGKISNVKISYNGITSDNYRISGTRINISGGKILKVSETGAPVGTMIEVKNLYFNTPARRKFLKTVHTEMGHIAYTVASFALAAPNVIFRLVHNGRIVKNYSESDTLVSRVGMILGTENIHDLYYVNSTKTVPIIERKIAPPIENKHDPSIEFERGCSKEEGVYITGYITKPTVSRNSSGNILIFVNKRVVSDRAILSAILRGYKGRLMKGLFPMAALFIDVPFDEVDVNVHPAKLQVRFANQSLVFGSVANAVHNALYHGEKRDGDNKTGGNFQNDISEIHESYNDKNTKSDFPHDIPQINESYNDKNTKSDFPHDIPQINESLHHTIVENFTPANDFTSAHDDFIVREEVTHLHNVGVGVDFTTTEHLAKVWKITNCSIIGQFANTYIITQSQNEMVLIDQHAAHERVIYERLKKRSQKFKPPSQNMIVPEIIEFNYKEASLMQKIIPQLADVGIEIEAFGGTSFVVKSVPAIIDNKSSIKPILRDIVAMADENIINEKDTGGKCLDKIDLSLDETSRWLDTILIMVACHSAIRANKKLNLKEMEQLIADLEKCENPYHCPHGRPTIIFFSEKELEKRFKRKT